jgi:vacuolar iron transporter family protein
MKLSIKKGFSFGLTSGIITTLGMIVGLNSGTHEKGVVIGGILIIAIADSLSDAFGMHISEEAENENPHSEVWASTWATFIAKFVFALSFVIPIVLFDLTTAVIVSIIWGLSVITIVSNYLAMSQGKKAIKVISEHLCIAIVVIILTYFVGRYISHLFS